MKQNKILIIGTVPPPTGGVTIHVKRLLDLLDSREISYTFFDYRRQSPWALVNNILRYRIIHCHFSNIYYSFILVILSRLLGKTIILTRHGDINRNHGIKKNLDVLSIQLSSVPILLNKNSYEIGKKVNPGARLLSAFIPPKALLPLPASLLGKITTVRQKYRYIFCTNAFDLSFDSQGRETYGLSELLKIFQQLPGYFLFAATCNQNYMNFLKTQNIEIPENVYIITESVDYVALMKETDASIRHTTTDGDALSVHEALYCKHPVFATDCVSRPAGTTLYHDGKELLSLLKDFKPYVAKAAPAEDAEKIIKLYSRFLYGDKI